MTSYSPHIPLSEDAEDGFTVNTTIVEALKQNFLMLLLTNPGEYPMRPTYGIGIKRFLFENFGTATYADIQNRITSETRRWMPQIRITNISFDNSLQDESRLGMRIEYSIPAIGSSDSVDVEI